MSYFSFLQDFLNELRGVRGETKWEDMGKEEMSRY